MLQFTLWQHLVRAIFAQTEVLCVVIGTPEAPVTNAASLTTRPLDPGLTSPSKLLRIRATLPLCLLYLTQTTTLVLDYPVTRRRATAPFALKFFGIVVALFPVTGKRALRTCRFAISGMSVGKCPRAGSGTWTGYPRVSVRLPAALLVNRTAMTGLRTAHVLLDVVRTIAVLARPGGITDPRRTELALRALVTIELGFIILFLPITTRAPYPPLALRELMSIFCETHPFEVPVTLLRGCRTLLKTPRTTLGFRSIETVLLAFAIALFGPSFAALLKIRMAATFPPRLTTLFIRRLGFIQITLETPNLSLFPRQTMGLPILQTTFAPSTPRLLAKSEPPASRSKTLRERATD